MIVPMKRVALLCLVHDQEHTLTVLRDMGIMHLTPVATPDSGDLDQVRVRLAAAREAAEVLAGVGPSQAGSSSPGAVGDVDLVIQEVQALVRRRKDLLAALEALERERMALAPFGEFEPDAVRKLEAAGIIVRLVQMSSRENPPMADGVVARVLSEDASSRYVVVISREAVDCAGRDLPLPPRGLKAVEGEAAASRRALDDIAGTIDALRSRLVEVEERVGRLEDREQFLMARDGMGTWERVTYLKGYCPAETEPALRQRAGAEGWGVLIDDPAPDEAVPTLLRNPGWVRPIKAIFKIIGIVPGYNEVDISGVFLLFYSVFFAMLVGDAGYGLLFLSLTGAIRRFGRKVPPDVPRLLGTLSVCTIVWGVLTGSYFGIRVDELQPLLQRGRIDWLTDETNLMSLCFLIGSIHLTVAHVWNGWRARRQLTVLAQAGWVAITWTMYFLAGNMILGKPMPGFVLPLFLAGLAGVVLFMTPMKAMKTEWPNHVMLPLSVVGNFGDVVSYVRLFAVGSAGAAISMAFNDMAVGGGISSFGAGLTAALILFLAHAMNILLSALGVIVHGVRLNTLEFSGHLGMQWTGTPFRPFRKRGAGEDD